jgi:hypothetical protein
MTPTGYLASLFVCDTTVPSVTGDRRVAAEAPVFTLSPPPKTAISAAMMKMKRWARESCDTLEAEKRAARNVTRGLVM